MNLKDNLKLRIALVVFGSFIGLGFGLLVAKGVLYLSGRTQLEEGRSSFDSVEDLRRAMLENGEADTKADGNVSLRHLIQPDPSDLIIYKLRAGVQSKFQGVDVRLNQSQMRGPEITLEKPSNTFRLALLGDSFAFGWGVEEQKIFATVIERELNKRLQVQQKQVQVLNFGVPGYSTFQEVADFQANGLKYKPDAVLVYFVENDFGLPFFIKNFADSGNLESNQKFSTLKKKSEDTEAEKGHIELLRNLNPNQALAKLAETCRNLKLDCFTVINPNRKQERLQARLTVFQREASKGLSLIDIRPRLLEIISERGIPKEDLNLANDPHPSAIKHGIIGELLADKLWEALGERWQNTVSGEREP